MPTPPDLEFSREIATAATLSNEAEDVVHFFEKPVLLTGEPEILATPNGRECFLDSVLLLVRMTADLTIQVLGGKNLHSEVEQLVGRVQLKTVVVTTEEIDFKRFQAILSVGTQVRRELPWTVVNSNGWTARVSSAEKSLSAECSQYNPIAALAAASLGATEVFKRLIRLKPERGGLQDGLCFSVYTYEVTDDAGPVLPDNLQCDNLLIVGAGAIGNGIVRLLQKLPLGGTISIVDCQDYQGENLGTCLLIGRDDVTKAKANIMAELLGRGARGFKEDIREFISERLGKELPYPDPVLNGLDDIEARRHVQTIWPDLVIDGAIGAVSCEVSLHPWGPDLSCLICDFELPPESAARKESALTGIPEERLSDLLAPVTEDDVVGAPPEKAEWLRKRIGKQKCSVISEAELEKMAQEQQTQRFEPSVPFVACLSSVMIVAEMVRHLAGWPAVLETGFQFDALIGPQNGIRKAHARKPNCVCVERRNTIELLKNNRTR